MLAGVSGCSLGNSGRCVWPIQQLRKKASPWNLVQTILKSATGSTFPTPRWTGKMQHTAASCGRENVINMEVRSQSIPDQVLKAMTLHPEAHSVSPKTQASDLAWPRAGCVAWGKTALTLFSHLLHEEISTYVIGVLQQ